LFGDLTMISVWAKARKDVLGPFLNEEHPAYDPYWEVLSRLPIWPIGIPIRTLTRHLGLATCIDCSELLKQLQLAGYDVGGWNENGHRMVAIAPPKGPQRMLDPSPAAREERKQRIKKAQDAAEKYYKLVYNGDRR
jgi:hypothetical protein